MGQLDDLFKMFYYGICDIGKWIFAIRMATGIIKSAESFDMQSTIKILIGGGFSYGALYSIISVLDAVQKVF